MKKGDMIFFESSDDFIVDRAKEIVEIHGNFLIVPQEYDWLTLEGNELLDDSDSRVKRWKAVHLCCDKSVKLEKAKNWLKYNLRDYYESDEWSSFNFDRAIEDFCVAMNED